MFLTILLSVLVGIILTLLVQAYYVRKYYLGLPQLTTPVSDQFPPFILPKEIKQLFDEGNIHSQKDSFTCLNLILQFLFSELKDTQSIRKWMIDKLNFEFEEMLHTTTGKLIDQIMVRDFTLGSTFPVLKSASVKNIVPHSDNQIMQELEILADFEYNGGFQISVDVDLVFGKSAFLSIKVTQLKGVIRFQLSRNPFTHWSFSFVEDPVLEFDVDSQFEGRPMPQITSLIINQIRRSIRKKHTMPNYKIRFNPLFSKPTVLPTVQDIYLFGRKATVGQFTVTVLECSRLLKVPPDCKIYCTLALDNLPWVELMCNRRKLWTTRDIDIFKGAAQSLGLVFKEEFLLDKYEEVVMVETVTPYSPASDAGMQKNDVIIAVNGIRVGFIKQAVKMMKQAGDKFSVRVERASVPRQQSHEVTIDEGRITLKDGDLTVSGEEEEDEYINITVRPQANDSPQIMPRRDHTPTRDNSRERSKGFSFLSAGSGIFHRRKSGSVEASPAVTPNGSPEPTRKLIYNSEDMKTSDDECPVQARGRRAQSDGSIEVLLPSRKISNGSDGGSPKKSNNSTKLQSTSSASKISTMYSGPLRYLDSLGTVEVKKTKLVTGSAEPYWDEKFQFEVEENHKYLNVCVWYRAPEKLDKQSRIIKFQKDLLIGHISVPLMPIVSETLMTLQGDTQKVFYLCPPEGKAGASRGKNSISSHPGFDEKISHGDITLAFRHKPKPLHAKECADDKRERFVDCEDEEEDESISLMSDESVVLGSKFDEQIRDHGKRNKKFSFLVKRFSAKSNSTSKTSSVLSIVPEGRHDFIGTQFHSATYCHFCAKKIWLKVAFQCRICAMICHKKCTEKCQKQTLCSADGPLPKFPFEPHNDPEDGKVEDKSPPPTRSERLAGPLQKSAALLSRFTRRDSPKLARKPSGRDGNYSQVISQSKTPSPSALNRNILIRNDNDIRQTKDDQAIPNKATLALPDTVPRTKSSTSIDGMAKENAMKPEDFLDKPDGDDSVVTDSSDEEEEAMMLQIMKDYHKSSHNKDELVVTAAKQMGKELYVHMSPEERREKLDSMITKFQHEIDAESDHRAELGKLERESLDPKQKTQIRHKIVKSDEKIQSLAVLMLHYCAGLQHCIDNIEEASKEEQDCDNLSSTDGLESESVLDINADVNTDATTSEIEQNFAYGER